MSDNVYMKNLLGAFAIAASHAIEQRIDLLGGRNISHEIALVTVYNHPNESIDVLRKILDMSHSGAVKLVNVLEEDGLMIRCKSQLDARVTGLKVTDLGAQRVSEILSSRDAILSDVVCNLTGEQREQLIPIIESMMHAMTTDEPSARKICKMCNEDVCRKRGCPVENSIC
ncbi:MarR family winged helix-turn-helix transcriptional regulator [Vibrio harveyi]